MRWPKPTRKKLFPHIARPALPGRIAAEALPFQNPQEPASAGIVGRQRNFHEIARADPDKVFLPCARRVNEDNILSIIQHYAHNCMWHQLEDSRPQDFPLGSDLLTGPRLLPLVFRPNGAVAFHVSSIRGISPVRRALLRYGRVSTQGPFSVIATVCSK